MSQTQETTLAADLAVFGACADETRLRILFLLAQRELCVCELVEILQMPQGKVSRHLAVLKGAGLARDRREGIWIYYALEPAASLAVEHLHAYLRAARSPQAEADRQRLQELAACGTICCRRS